MPEQSYYTLTPGLFSLDRMALAVSRVRERLVRATAALKEAGVPYAVAGGNAVFLWVEASEEGGTRNTPNVDLLINRADLQAAAAALEAVGFAARPETLDLFLDGPNGSPRTRLRLLFAGEKSGRPICCPILPVQLRCRLGRSPCCHSPLWCR